MKHFKPGNVQGFMPATGIVPNKTQIEPGNRLQGRILESAAIQQLLQGMHDMPSFTQSLKVPEVVQVGTSKIDVVFGNQVSCEVLR